MKNHILFTEQLVNKGGPKPAEYETFTQWLNQIAFEVKNGNINQQELDNIRNCFGEAISTETMQGFAFQKPHGYAGDFEIIDRIYQESCTENPKLKNWDRYFHAQSAPKAVRNRKKYFIKLLNGLEKRGNAEGCFNVLNVASGPARDMFEFLSTPNGKISFDCIEMDKNAIDYAKSLLSTVPNEINFINTNALKFRTEKRYHLIWSAGLFDYFDDRLFVLLLKRLLRLLENDGEIVIGNFSKNNSTRNYMEIVGDWHLNHRSEDELIRLALRSGVSPEQIKIDKEVEGVNLFLRIKNAI